MNNSHDDTNSPDSRSANLRVGRYSERLACYAITKCVHHRHAILDNKDTAQIVLESFDHFRERDEIRVLAFCIMPDHYHLLTFLFGSMSLDKVMESIGRFTSRQINRHLESNGRFWQEGYYDHRCRDEADIEERLVYIEHNPVRAELVRTREDWPFSSAHLSNRERLDRAWYAEWR